MKVKVMRNRLTGDLEAFQVKTVGAKHPTPAQLQFIWSNRAPKAAQVAPLFCHPSIAKGK